MKAYIDEGCIGCGQCEEVCPEVFRMNDEGLAEVYADLTKELLSTAKEAEDDCPVEVIRIEE